MNPIHCPADAWKALRRSSSEDLEAQPVGAVVKALKPAELRTGKGVVLPMVALSILIKAPEDTGLKGSSAPDGKRRSAGGERDFRDPPSARCIGVAVSGPSEGGRLLRSGGLLVLVPRGQSGERYPGAGIAMDSDVHPAGLGKGKNALSLNPGRFAPSDSLNLRPSVGADSKQ